MKYCFNQGADISNLRKKDNWAVIAIRVVLGGLFLMAGMDTFIPFLPMEIVPSEALASLGEGHSYLIYTLKATEVIVGVCLIFNLLAPLMLVILAPIVLNITLFSIFENPANLPMAAVVLLGHISLVTYYRKLFYSFLKPQLYSHTWQDETSNILVLEEVEEKMPEKVKIVKDLISQIEN